MTNFISVKYCIVYILSLYTIGSYGLFYPSNVNKLSTKLQNKLKLQIIIYNILKILKNV